jgi:hypothetical protein
MTDKKVIDLLEDVLVEARTERISSCVIQKPEEDLC